MKKSLLSIAVSLAALSACAQPTLTSGNLNPVPGDVFYGHSLDTMLVPGAPGATAATWNFAGLVATGMDTTTYFRCDATPYCDSFSGSNIAAFDNTQYVYGDTSTALFKAIGVVPTAGAYVHVDGTFAVAYYPLTFNSTYRDSFSVNIDLIGSYHTEVDSMIYDAFGTIILPTGTYTNAVRVHTFAYAKDSSAFAGVSSGLTETYNWFVSGFHNPIFAYSIDTSGSGSYYAEYYTRGLTLAVPTVNTSTADMMVYPNPAGDVVNVQFTAPGNTKASATLSDLSGRVVATISSDRIIAGANEISFPVAGLPGGLYFVRVQTAAGIFTKKVTVAH